MAETETETKQGTTFDQASREATGARPYGRYLEDFEEGAVYKHWPAKTVTEADDHLFCLITMNHHPLHINDVYARQSQQGRTWSSGPLVYSLALGMTVARHLRQGDRQPGDRGAAATRRRSSTATRCTPSPRCSRCGPPQSKPDRGVVKVRTDVYNQRNELVATFRRAVLVPRAQPGELSRDRDARAAADPAESP